MKQEINQKRVLDAIVEMNKVLVGMKLNQAEVMLAAQELVGRCIVEMANTPTSAAAIAETCVKHLGDTVRIGLETRGFRDQPVIQTIN